MSDTPPDVVTLRFPGGRLTPEDWQTLAGLAVRYGDGAVHVTRRGGVELRATEPVSGLTGRVRDAGLDTIDGQRAHGEVLASPLAGRLRGRQAVHDLPEQLDRELAAHPGAAAASGVVLGVDDGSGDVLAHRPDLGIRLSTADPGRADLAASGADVGYHAALSEVTAILAGLAEVVAGAASRDLPPLVEETLAGDGRVRPGSIAASEAAGQVPPVGWIDTEDGSVSLLAVTDTGAVSGRLAEFVAAVERPTTVSPGGVLGIHELTEHAAEQVVRVLAPMGLIFDASSEWARTLSRSDRET